MKLESHCSLIRKILIVFLFFSTANTLLPFPIDKVCMIIVAVGILLCDCSINKIVFLIFSFIMLLQSFIIIVNCFFGKEISLIVYFPIVGVLFAYLAGRYFHADEILFALRCHLLLGMFFLIYAYGSSSTMFVHYLYDKGLPFLIAPMGFTSTVQTFGTLCLSYLIISFKETKSYFSIIVFFLLVSTFNRVSYINFFIFILLLKPHYLWFLLLFGVLISIGFSEYVIQILSTTRTVLSRFGFFDSYFLTFKDSAFFQKIFGNSNSLITEKNILFITEQPLIENGFFSLLNAYGMIGLLFLCLFLLCLFFLNDKILIIKYKIFLVYFITVGQFMTNEYFSTSFYFAIMCIIYIINKDRRIDVE
jgi:hypothetical protein